MEDLDSRIAPLVAYAALVCGGVVACLLLLAGPARADAEPAPDTERSGGLLPLDEVGQQVAGTTRRVGTDAGAAVDEVVREVADPVRRVAPRVTGPVADLAEDAGGAVTGEVGAVTGGVATGVEQVTSAVDAVVEAPVAPAAPTPATPAGPGSAPDADPRPGDRATGPSDAPRARTTPARDRTGPPDRPPARTERVPAPAATPAASSVPAALAVPAPAPTHAVAGPVTDELPSLALLRDCDDCAATAGSSGDPQHVLGLPTPGVTTPRSAGVVPRSVRVGGPATVFREPDVSPD